MITRSSGFSLVELLVVIAIIGIISTVGLISYQGYISTSKRSAALNTMQTVSLAQSEYLSNMGTYYYTNAAGADCDPDDASSTAIETKLFDGADIITSESGYEMCIALNPPDTATNSSGDDMTDDDTGYVVVATDGADTEPVQVFLNHDGTQGTY